MNAHMLAMINKISFLYPLPGKKSSREEKKTNNKTWKEVKNSE